MTKIIKTNAENMYPSWVCRECALQARGCITNDGRVYSRTEGRCDVCGELKNVSRPKDYGYPIFTPAPGVEDSDEA